VAIGGSTTVSSGGGGGGGGGAGNSAGVSGSGSSGGGSGGSVSGGILSPKPGHARSPTRGHSRGRLSVDWSVLKRVFDDIDKEKANRIGESELIGGLQKLGVAVSHHQLKRIVRAWKRSEIGPAAHAPAPAAAAAQKPPFSTTKITARTSTGLPIGTTAALAARADEKAAAAAAAAAASAHTFDFNDFKRFVAFSERGMTDDG
jgi:hypothetical protein